MKQNHTMPLRAELKLRARAHMGRAFMTCAALGGAVVVAGLLLEWLYTRSGGVINLYYWDIGTSDIQTSFSLSRQGLFAALRLEEAGLGFSVAVTPALLGTFLLVRLLLAAVSAPLTMGCLDNLWAVRQGQPRPFRTVFRWYTDLRRALRAVVMELVLTAVQLVLQGVCTIPALLVFGRSGGQLAAISAALWLMVAAQAVTWCLMTQLMPAEFLLARDSEMGVLAAFRAGWALLKGRHGQYLIFRLSFILWELVNGFARGMMNLYLFPYIGLANMEWITECGDAREQGDAVAEHDGLDASKEN